MDSDLDFTTARKCRFGSSPTAANADDCIRDALATPPLGTHSKDPSVRTTAADGRWLVSAGFDGVHLWDATNWQQVAYLPIGHQEISFFDARGQELFTYGRTGLYRWPIGDWPKADCERVMLGPPRRLPFAAGWDWDYRACTERRRPVARSRRSHAATRSRLPIWNALDQQISIDDQRGIISVALSFDGRYLATAHYQTGD